MTKEQFAQAQKLQDDISFYSKAVVLNNYQVFPEEPYFDEVNDIIRKKREKYVEDLKKQFEAL